MTKDEQRNIALARRKSISEFDHDILSNSVCFEFMVRTNLRKFDNIMIYKSMNSEVKTDRLIEILLSMGKHLSVPFIDENDVMRAAKIDVNTEYVLDKFGIQTPKEVTFENNIELCICPLVAFDEDCNRLGYGKGYYDKFLSDKNTVNIGLAFDCQKVDKILSEKTDVRLDGVITSSKIYVAKNVF